MTYTITYSPALGGWSSFHSFYPDWMASMNNDFYTFKNGKVWKHYTNESRNNYYGVNEGFHVETLFNMGPDEPKMFKTVKVKGTSVDAFDATVYSDLSNGSMLAESFAKKEGNWFSYVRRNTGNVDTTFLSSQGLGSVISASIDIISGNISIILSGDVISLINVKSTGIENGDLIYRLEPLASTKQLIGQALSVSYSATTNRTTLVITLSGAVLALPSNGDFIMAVKNSVAESYGLRGVYMGLKLESEEEDHVEIFSVASEVFKSYV